MLASGALCTLRNDRYRLTGRPRPSAIGRSRSPDGRREAPRATIWFTGLLDSGRNELGRAVCAPALDSNSVEVAIKLTNCVITTIDPQIVQLKSAGIDTLVEQSSSKAAAQSIRKVHELN
jgi:hypothetical protein